MSCIIIQCVLYVAQNYTKIAYNGLLCMCRAKYGKENVILSDIKRPTAQILQQGMDIIAA